MNSPHHLTKRALLIAFHFPPATGSSGVHRAYSLARYLPENGWQPIVLTASLRAYPAIAPDLVNRLPSDLLIRRAIALDTAKHLSVRGIYPDLLAWPDRWVTWWPSAIALGLQAIKQHRPKVIWSTYPIATAHLIALTLSKLSGIPWIADFRDSMTEEHYPTEPTRRRIFRWIERKTIERACRVVFTAPSTMSLYRDRYPDYEKDKWAQILNGYDEDAFASVAGNLDLNSRSEKQIIVHSGVIYPKERNPSHLFRAISSLRQRGIVSETSVEIRLRATGHDNVYRPLIEELQLSGIVTLLPPLPYYQAIQEMMSVHGLLLLQAGSCNHQIPAKLYEYIRAGRPILALTEPEGDTASLLQSTGASGVAFASLESTQEIEDALCSFLDRLRSDGNQQGTNLGESTVKSFSRRSQVKTVAKMFDDAIEVRK